MHRKENREATVRSLIKKETVAICNAGENEKYLRRRFSSANIGYGFVYTHSRV